MAATAAATAWATRLAAALSCALLVGCTSNTPTLQGLSAATTSADTAASGSAFPDAEAQKRDAPVTAFGQIPDGTQSSRVVIENPSLAEVMQTGTLPDMAIGRADAPVTIIQYQSLTCPHCRAFHRNVFPEFKRTYIDTGKVRFILREFPIGKQSGNATVALRCAAPEKYFELYGLFMDQQAAWVSQEVRLDPIFAVAKQVGMNRDQFDSCLKNQGMIEGLKWIKERGRMLGIIGTPNYFVQGRLVKKTLAMSDIRELVEPLLVAPRAASAAQ